MNSKFCWIGCIDQDSFCGTGVKTCNLGKKSCDWSEYEIDTSDSSPPEADTPKSTNSPTSDSEVSMPTNPPDVQAESQSSTISQKFTALVMVILLFFPCCLSVAALQMNQSEEYHEAI